MISIASVTCAGLPSQRSLSGRHGNDDAFRYGFLIVNVIARQLDHANTDIRANWIALRIISSPCARTASSHCPAGNDDEQKGTWTARARRFNNRVHQRQTLLAAPVEARRRSSVSSTDISTKSKPNVFAVAGVPASTPRRGALFHRCQADLFGQHIRSLAPQFGDGTFD